MKIFHIFLAPYINCPPSLQNQLNLCRMIDIWQSSKSDQSWSDAFQGLETWHVTLMSRTLSLLPLLLDVGGWWGLLLVRSIVAELGLIWTESGYGHLSKYYLVMMVIKPLGLISKVYVSLARYQQYEQQRESTPLPNISQTSNHHLDSLASKYWSLSNNDLSPLQLQNIPCSLFLEKTLVLKSWKVRVGGGPPVWSIIIQSVSNIWGL